MSIVDRIAREQSNRYSDDFGEQSAYEDGFSSGVSWSVDNRKQDVEYFKSSLREEIEKRIDPQNYNGAHDFDEGQVYAYKEVLKILNP